MGDLEKVEDVLGIAHEQKESSGIPINQEPQPWPGPF